MLNPTVIEQLKAEFVPKFTECLGDLNEWLQNFYMGKFRYHTDAAARTKLAMETKPAVTVKLDFAFLYNDQQYEYTGICHIKCLVFVNDQQAQLLFQAVIQGTQNNCGMRELVYLSANGARVGGMKQDTFPIHEQIMQIGFDMIYKGLKESPHPYKSMGGYSCGVLVMSHEVNSYITKVARAHPMWQEIGIFNNPNYGGEKHEFVMFLSNINSTRIEDPSVPYAE